MQSRLVPLLLLLIGAVGSLAGCATGELSEPPPVDDPAATSAAPSLTISDVMASTLAGGDAKIHVRVRAHMPPDFDDGRPRRSFEGKGVLDQDERVAGVTYRL